MNESCDQTECRPRTPNRPHSQVETPSVCMVVRVCVRERLCVRDGTLWQGASGNRMLDTFNTERYSILYSKYVKIKSLFFGVQPTGLQQVGSGFATGNPTLSRATRIIKFWIPGHKIAKKGIVQYENQGTQVNFFDYHFMINAYSNYSTVDTPLPQKIATSSKGSVRACVCACMHVYVLCVCVCVWKRGLGQTAARYSNFLQKMKIDLTFENL